MVEIRRPNRMLSRPQEKNRFELAGAGNHQGRENPETRAKYLFQNNSTTQRCIQPRYLQKRVSHFFLTSTFLQKNVGFNILHTSEALPATGASRGGNWKKKML